MKLTACGVLLMAVLLGAAGTRALAQGSLIRWSAVDAGFGTQVLAGAKLTSAVGQTFTGSLQGRSSRIRGGFLAERVLRAGETGVNGPGDLPLPERVLLYQNYPNPFNPATTIRYGLPGRSHVVLAIFNILGQVVAELVNADLDAGYHEVRFNAGSLASGVYFYRLQTAALQGSPGPAGGGSRSHVEIKKLNLVK